MLCDVVTRQATRRPWADHNRMVAIDLVLATVAARLPMYETAPQGGR
jgi:hypothetical protein